MSKQQLDISKPNQVQSPINGCLYPNLKTQDKLLSIDSKIEDKEKIILGFLNYLEDLKKKLWKDSKSTEIVEKEIDQFSLKFSEKSQEKAELVYLIG